MDEDGFSRPSEQMSNARTQHFVPLSTMFSTLLHTNFISAVTFNLSVEKIFELGQF